MKPLGIAAVVATLSIAPWAAAQSQTPSGSGLEAAGLLPPDPMQRDPYAAPSQTEQELAEADRKDSGRGLEFFWINVEAGLEQVGLETFDANNVVDAEFVETKHFGPSFGAGLGVRLLFLTIGPRVRLGRFGSFDLWTFNAQLGFHVPIGIVEPYFTFGGGYAMLTSLGNTSQNSAVSLDEVSIRGWNARTGFGMDVYLTPVVSVGGHLTGELLGLTRPGVSPADLQRAATSSPTTEQEAVAAAEQIYEADGSSYGGAVTLSAVVGLHF
jgi:hypothetical protein